MAAVVTARLDDAKAQQRLSAAALTYAQAWRSQCMAERMATFCADLIRAGERLV